MSSTKSNNRTLPRLTHPEELREFAVESGYAVVGVTDLALDRVRQLQNTVLDRVAALPEQARSLPATAKAFTADTRSEVEQNFDDLAGRGKQVIGRLTGGKKPSVVASEVVADAAEQAAASVNKAAEQVSETADKAADRVSESADEAAADVKNATTRRASTGPAAKTATKKAGPAPRRPRATSTTTKARKATKSTSN